MLEELVNMFIIAFLALYENYINKFSSLLFLPDIDQFFYVPSPHLGAP
jgi:hypothetical protein